MENQDTIVVEPIVTPPTVEPQTDPIKTVSKEMFDKTASELAAKNKANKDLEKRLQDLENQGKTAEQLKLDELAKTEAKLKELTLKANKSTVNGILAEAKAKINLDVKEVDLEKIIGLTTNEDETATTENAEYISKLLLAVYTKGIADAKKADYNSMGDGFKSGGTNKPTSYGAKIAEQNKTNTNFESAKNLYK